MKKRHERKQITPLLYIHQPRLKHPKVKMQDQFKFQRNEEIINIDDVSEDILKPKKAADIDKGLVNSKGEQENSTATQEFVSKNIEKHELKKKIGQLESFIKHRKMQGLELEKVKEIDLGNSQEFDHMSPIENYKNVLESKLENKIQEKEEDITKMKLEEQANLISQEKPNKKHTSNRRVPFDEKSLDEKLKDLKRSPVSVVKIRYEFMTETEKFLGYFISHKDGVLLIQNLRKENKMQSIPFESIIDIKMIGI